MNRMKVRQLEHFLAVVEEGQFTQASVRCNIAQSGLSASVRALERELGSSLLHRSTRRVVLTDAGRALVPEARRVLAAVATARDAVEAVVGIEHGSLTIGTVISAGLWFDLPRLLAEFHHRHPMVEISLTAGGADELLDRVAALEVDMVLVGAPERLAPHLVSLPVASAPYMFACSTEHPLATRKQLDVAQLAGETFVDLGIGTTVRRVTDQLFASANQRRTVRFEVHDADTVLNLVAHGLGSAILAEPRARATDGVSFVPLAGKRPPWTLALVTQETSRVSRAAAAIFDLARESSSIR
jgi:DNA-binding transcriptional LysR family regulator